MISNVLVGFNVSRNVSDDVKAGLFEGKLDIRFIVISTFVSKRADNIALTHCCFEGYFIY